MPLSSFTNLFDARAVAAPADQRCRATPAARLGTSDQQAGGSAAIRDSRMPLRLRLPREISFCANVT